MTTTPGSFSDCIEQIEAAYEYMLAYAAQGRDREPQGSSPSIRDFLGNLQAALTVLEPLAAGEVARLSLSEASAGAVLGLATQSGADAMRALLVVNVALTAPSLSSQLIDNLNASAHLRCVLTDIFVLDEALQQHARAALASPAIS